MLTESDAVVSFKNWFQEHGGSFHSHAIYTQATYGYGLVAKEDIPAGEEIISCSFNLAITGPASQAAVSRLLGLKSEAALSVKQWICTYIALHWVVGKDDEASQCLIHFPYLELLPPPEELLTALYFTPEELELFKGTNLYGACNDRRGDWQTEWTQCRELISQSKLTWGIQFEWSLYLKAATYVSSRAFPSTVLSQTPELPNPDSDISGSEPVLLPGVDILNHSRGQPVSWITHTSGGNNKAGEMSAVERVSIVPRKATEAGHEIFNNYGPKPNAELVLGYGFTIPNNPDDTIILKVGGVEGAKWSIGRSATGVEGLWKEIVKAVQGPDYDTDSEDDYEALLDASGALQEMVSSLLERMPDPSSASGKANVRPQVAQMFEHYVAGQASILGSLLGFASGKEEEAIELARSQGVDLVLEDE